MPIRSQVIKTPTEKICQTCEKSFAIKPGTGNSRRKVCYDCKPVSDKYLGTSSLEQSTECWCPGCDTAYARKMFWSGNGTPRVFCNTCDVLNVDSSMLL
jgi:hypothetical protein